VPVIRANSPESQVGITLNLTSAYPSDPESPGSVAAARAFDGFMNRWFLDPLAGRGYPEDMWSLYGDAVPAVRDGDLPMIAMPTDFLGVNYYTPIYLAAGDQEPMPFTPVDVPGEYTEMGWLVEPQGLEGLLLRLHRDYPPKPLYITENGAAYDDPEPAAGRVPDPDRLRYLVSHLEAAKRAINAGADLRGYFAWSLLDNFEWTFGYSKRFGIVHVDYATQTRTIKDSGRWYANVAKANQLVP
jgi:beta-glucosidase